MQVMRNRKLFFDVDPSKYSGLMTDKDAKIAEIHGSAYEVQDDKEEEQAPAQAWNDTDSSWNNTAEAAPVTKLDSLTEAAEVPEDSVPDGTARGGTW